MFNVYFMKIRKLNYFISFESSNTFFIQAIRKQVWKSVFGDANCPEYNYKCQSNARVDLVLIGLGHLKLLSVSKSPMKMECKSTQLLKIKNLTFHNMIS